MKIPKHKISKIILKYYNKGEIIMEEKNKVNNVTNQKGSKNSSTKFLIICISIVIVIFIVAITCIIVKNINEINSPSNSKIPKIVMVNNITTCQNEVCSNTTCQNEILNNDAVLINEILNNETISDNELQNQNKDKFNKLDICYKPIIYLYPTETMNVNVRLLDNNYLTCSYPKYIDGWNVKAESNGNLTDLKTGRNLYSLYYESNSKVDFKVETDGFVVKGEDSAKFLEDKLSLLGLNQRESEEFIVYWLPKLESNKYNYIRFATKDEINKNMGISINPNPDTLIRVLMTYKGLDESIEVKEQKIETPIRKGFVAVEWGGTEIK